MSEEYREIEVVEVGSGPPKAPKPPRDRNRTDLLLTLLVVGVFLGAAASAYAAWTVHQSQQDERMLNCMYLVSFPAGDEFSDEDVTDRQEKVIDRFGCEVPDR